MWIQAEGKEKKNCVDSETLPMSIKEKESRCLKNAVNPLHQAIETAFAFSAFQFGVDKCLLGT